MDVFGGQSPHQQLGENDIRLARLFPGDFHDPIRCELDHVSLVPGLDYEALTYAWGDPTDTLPISLNAQEYPITRNLYLALQYLRPPANSGTPRTLWVDSICINQGDLRERSAQIQRMRDVYKLAKEVRVWLGDSEPIQQSEVDRCFSYLSGNETEIPPSPDQILEQGIPKPGSMFWRVGRLTGNLIFTKPWFTRAWVVQEVCVRSKVQSPILTCGSAEIPLITFFSFYETLQALLNIHASYIKALELIPVSQMFDMWKFHQTLIADPRDLPLSSAEQLTYYLRSIVRFQVTDFHDRIYAILGLLRNDDLPHELAPNYERTAQDMFHSYAVYILQQTRCVDIIHFNSGMTPGMPSWVPDWEKEAQDWGAEDSVLPLAWQHRFQSPAVELLSHNTKLRVACHFFCEVEVVGPKFAKLKETTLNQKQLLGRQYLLDVESVFRTASAFIHESPEQFYAAWEAFILQNYEEAEQEVMKSRFMTLVHGSSEGKDFTSDTDRLATDFIANHEGTCLFVCGNGSFGQSFVSTQPGDRLGRLHGSSRVSILRRDGDDEYVVVGKASGTVMNIDVIMKARSGRSLRQMTSEDVDVVLEEFWANAKSETIIIH